MNLRRAWGRVAFLACLTSTTAASQVRATRRTQDVNRCAPYRVHHNTIRATVATTITVTWQVKRKDRKWRIARAPGTLIRGAPLPPSQQCCVMLGRAPKYNDKSIGHRAGSRCPGTDKNRRARREQATHYLFIAVRQAQRDSVSFRNCRAPFWRSLKNEFP